MSSLHRVVVTGVGVVAAGSSGAEAYWRRILSGVSAVGPLTKLPPGDGCRMAAEVGPAELGMIENPEHRFGHEVDRFALAAATEAGRAAGYTPGGGDLSGDDVGCSIGVFSGPVPWAMGNALEGTEMDPINPRVHRFSAVIGYFGSILGNVTIPLGICGPSVTHLTLDVAGTDAIGYAYEVIRHGGARAMLAGGADCGLNPFVFTALDLAGFLSREADEPARACLPFDQRSGGMVLGEGAAVLFLESLESARERGRPVYAEVLGYQSTADGHRARSMQAVLDGAGVRASEVDCIVANATGYAPLDYQEARCIRRVFGTGPEVTGVTWAVGHTLGAAGAMQAAAAALVLRDQAIPPVRAASAEAAPRPPRRSPVRYVLQSTIGFSGKNSFLLFGQPN